MATHPTNIVTVRAVWRRGWALMWAGRTTDGYELLSGLKLSDLACIGTAERPDRIVVRVQSVAEKHPSDAKADPTVMEALTFAASQGDREASELLIFGDLGEELTLQNTSCSDH